MTPRRVVRRVQGSPADARARRDEGDLLFERAELGDESDARARKVDVAIAVLAGIAYADSICLAALGERSAGGNHQDAVALLDTVDAAAAADLQVLVGVKTKAQYGVATLPEDVSRRALRAAGRLRVRARGL